MSNPLKFLLVFLLFIVGSVYIFYSNVLQPDPKRISIDENGEEIIVLNELEKQLVGKWFMASEQIKGLKKRRYNRTEGSYIYFKDSGLKQSIWKKKSRALSRWEVNPKDSLITLTRQNGRVSQGKINSISSEELKIHYFAQPKMGVVESDVVLKRY